MSKTQFKDHYATQTEVLELLDKAEDGAKTDSAVKFVDDMIHSFNRFGMDCSVSYAQLNWLKKLSGEDV